MATATETSNLWTGTPVYWQPSFDHEEQVSRVFHRDRPGIVVAKFKGAEARDNARLFCGLFGERDGSREAAEAAGDFRHKSE